MGNGTETTYDYDEKRLHLSTMSLTSNGVKMMENVYKYNNVDNILGISNATAPTGEIGGSYNHSYQYDKKLPGIDPADRNRTFSNDATSLTQKGLPDRRYKPRTAIYNYMGNVPTASGKTFAYGALVLDATIMGLQTAQSCMMLYDLDALSNQRNSLIKAFNTVKEHVSNGGILPSEYNNSDGYGKLVDYVFQDSSSDDTIQQIGNQMLKKVGRYDKETKKYNPFIEK